MLAGRKLLLADDSATIQKVVDLTFADEGVRVLAVSSGQEALDKILDFAPDIVLADVFMPSPDGYEVCRYVKTNEKLKHIPVVLLVGSFEPFDEAEARRVGADDILTKPFQSIRRLIDRVGALVSSPPPVEKENPTAEL
ncbi:MAG TPA: response regulator, partial [Pyrinomonadaceae bacterium]|nr:response regulator [Pyrinomonadaceae bacterium]